MNGRALFKRVWCRGQSDPGVFLPRSPFWQVNRELLINLAASRALLLELAHPLVAAGVARHSNFRQSPLGRLYRTARVMTDLTFGTGGEAHRAVRHVGRCHRRVQGVLEQATGPFPEGTPYDANDPQLKLWVWATLIDSTLLVHKHFVAPLSNHESHEYYRDARRLGELLGVPPDTLPNDLVGFEAYTQTMLNSNALTVGDTARRLSEALFATPLIGRLAFIASFVGIGLLPARLREGFGFHWDEGKEKWLQRLASTSRRVRPRLPDPICVSPKALIVELRSRWNWRGVRWL